MEITCIADWIPTYRELRERILGLPSPKTRMDLTKILTGIDGLIRQLSIEEVECRRLHKVTAKHNELIAAINERIQFLEQMITWGALAT